MLIVTPEERGRLLLNEQEYDRLLPQCLSSRQVDRAGNQTHAGQWAADRQANAAAQRDRSLDPYAEDRMEAISPGGD